MLKKSAIVGGGSLVLVVLLSATPCWGQAREVRTDDGLALHLADDGRLSGVSVDGKMLPRPAGAFGGFTLLDVEARRADLGRAKSAKNEYMYDPKPLRPLRFKNYHSTSRDGLEATWVDQEAGLELKASYVVKPARIRADVEVTDLRKTDRRVAVGYVIPLDATGWTWCDNVCRKRRVAEPTVYRWTCRTEMGDGALTIYPFNSLGNDEVALTLGVPLDQGPRVWNVGYDHANKQLLMNFHLGISQATKKFPGKATCSFILYRHDPACLSSGALEFCGHPGRVSRKLPDSPGCALRT